jgi:hypothetical protein
MWAPLGISGRGTAYSDARVFAVGGSVPITARANTDIPPAMSSSAVDVNADCSTPVYSVAPPSTVDIDIDIAALLSATRSFITGPHLRALCRTPALILRRARSLIHAPATKSFFISLLQFVHEPFETDRLIARERRHVVSACGECEHRYSGAQHQHVSHLNHPSRFAPASAQAFGVNVRMEETFCV